MKANTTIACFVLILGITFLIPKLLWIYLFFILYYIFSKLKTNNNIELKTLESDIDINEKTKSSSPINFYLEWKNIEYKSTSIKDFLFDLLSFNTVRKKYYENIEKYKVLLNLFESHKMYNTIELKLINENLTQKNNDLKKILTEKENLIKLKKMELNYLEEKESLSLLGFLSPLYNLGNSEIYKKKLEEIQNLQKEEIKNNNALNLGTQWVIGGDAKTGKKMMSDISKLILRSFNNECDTLIAKVKYSNLESVSNKIYKSYESVNKLATVLNISINRVFLDLKIKELFVNQSYEIQKQLEKEKVIYERQKLKEESKLAQEIERERLINEKERTHFLNKKMELLEKLKNDYFLTPEKRKTIEQNLAAITISIEICDNKDKDLDYRENKASAGYVYVISNIGSFGENIYKIGVTRRLEPQDRIDELASASVPFRFDVHTMIFSEEAFKLETALHKAFDKQRVNLLNNRKEFFKLDLKDLNHVLKTNFNKHFELQYNAEALDFRESERLRNKFN